MENETRKDTAPAPKRSDYDPPQVERVINADEIDREVHYAGSVSISDTPG